MAKKKEWFWYEEPPGQPIYRCPDDLINNKRIQEKDALKEGDQIVLQTIFPGKAAIATVQKNEYGVLHGENEGMLFNLGYCDERKIWVCFCQMNKLAIRKIEEVKC